MPSHRPATARCRKQNPLRRLWFEQLEDRLTPAVSVSITDTSPVEGNAGTTNMVFTITRTGDTSGAIFVNYTTENGTAIGNTDYLAASPPLPPRSPRRPART